ncbi:MAG: toll/interleukin-1 receptor domain-containing protein [Clostridia bacterium]|nr:toll/interleukin-1 receptor domain-containing protein [Clostridia bacterium]
MQKLYLGNDPYVFVSYSFKDKEIALELSRALMINGCNLWLDAGSASREENAQRLLDAECVLLLVTRNSIVSRHVERDLSLARKNKKPVYTVYLENFGLQLNATDPYRLAECDEKDAEKNIFRLRNKIINGLPREVFNKAEEPFYISELNRFYTESEINYLPCGSEYEKEEQFCFGACIVNDKGEKITLWKYAPSDEYSLCARLSSAYVIDDPYFVHRDSKSVVATLVFSFTERAASHPFDCDIVLTVAIAQLDSQKPKITLVNCVPLKEPAKNEQTVLKKLIEHIAESFK